MQSHTHEETRGGIKATMHDSTVLHVFIRCTQIKTCIDKIKSICCDCSVGTMDVQRWCSVFLLAISFWSFADAQANSE